MGYLVKWRVCSVLSFSVRFTSVVSKPPAKQRKTAQLSNARQDIVNPWVMSQLLHASLIYSLWLNSNYRKSLKTGTFNSWKWSEHLWGDVLKYKYKFNFFSLLSLRVTITNLFPETLKILLHWKFSSGN